MLGFLPPVLRGAIAFVLLALNTLFWCTLLFVLRAGEAGAAVPRRARAHRPGAQRHRHRLDRLQQRLDAPHAGARAGTWRASTELPYEGWYLVNCNHQSWVDIFVLQHLLNRRIPMLKFFLKQQLIYVPVIGLAWWALDFPFMKRHGKAAAAQAPRAAAAGHRGHAPGLREVRAGAHQRDELRRGHALHAARSTGPRLRRTATCSSPRPARWRWP